MAGVAGLNRVAEYLKAFPDEAVIFFSVELCSLTMQIQDISVANLISSGLFGDGGAAVLMVGDKHPLRSKAKLKWHSSKSIFFPNTEDVMGWKVGASGLKIILSKSVPVVTAENLPSALKDFLPENNLSLQDISTFFAHPGGPKVLEAMEKVLDLPQKGLIHSWNSLAENGNMSSVSVLDIFKRIFNESDSKPKSGHALSVAMGPAFSTELGLFEWVK
jgi:alkylresorcinol/alkylpyrone synthase